MRMKPEYMVEFDKAENEFRQYHSNSLKAGCGAVSSLVKACLRVPVLLPEDLISFFCQLRIYFRIKQLNSKLSLERKRKSLKKMYKLI